MDRHAKFLAPLAQDPQQTLPADRREPVPARCEDVPVVVHVDVVPDCKVLREPLIKGGVGVFDATERLVGKDDAEPERVVRGVSFPDLYLVVGVQELDQRRQVEPRRPATDDRDLEVRLRGPQLVARSRNRCSLPVAVRGSASANSIARGYL